MGSFLKKITHLPLLIVILVTAIFRLAYLDRIPNAIGGDELTYVLTAKSIFLTGKDLSGTWQPLSAFIFRYPKDQLQAELPYFLHLPFSGAFPFSLFTAKFPFALLSIGIVVLLFLLTKRLLGDKEAFIVGLVAAANPWLLYMGRTAYESTPATFFFLLGLYFLLTLKNMKLLWSIPVFFLGFYSYIGTKLIFLPFVILSVGFSFMIQKKYGKQYIAIILSALVIVIFYIFMIKTAEGARTSELFLPNMQELANHVDAGRKTTMPNFFTSLFVNKWTLYAKQLTTRFLRIFSPTYLFLEGDQFFSIQNHGFFYLADFLFLLIGGGYVFAKKRLFFFFLLASIALSTLPHVLHTTQGDFSGHIAFMFPFFVIFIGCGIYWIIHSVPARLTRLTIIAVALFYSLCVGNFLFIYFFQHPLKGYFDFSMRVTSKYIQLARQKDIPVHVYTNAHTDYLKKYLFYTNAINKKSIENLQQTILSNSFDFNGITFFPCGLPDIQQNSQITYVVDTNCGNVQNHPHIRISGLSDSGEKYRIYNDSICNKYALQPYIANITLRDFLIEQLNERQFCETYINR